MKEKIRYQCRIDLKLRREILNITKDEIAEKVFSSVRTIERIECKNATTNEETAKLISNFYNLKFHEHFYVLDNNLDEFFKKELAGSYKPGNNKVNYDSTYHCLYIRKISHFEDCIFGKGVWVRDHNKNKEVRTLAKLDMKVFTKSDPAIPIINEHDEWRNWYHGLTIGKIYKAAVSIDCMKVCLKDCLNEVIIRKDKNIYYFDDTSDMMYWGAKKALK